tara:strand:+ start:102 stop:392 length:291 start_codon:yes stop_codon:yes gene_type:complete
MRTFLFLTVALWASIGYTGEWVASVPVSAPPPPMVITTPVPSVTYVVPQTTVVYGWVPYYYNAPVVTERRCWFLRKERRITYQPQLQWYYQPLYYR